MFKGKFNRRCSIHSFNQGHRVTHIESFSLARASLAVSRYVLSLDPLRDPMGVLLALDHFALLSNSEVNDRWLVAFVESHKVRFTWGFSRQVKSKSKNFSTIRFHTGSNLLS